MRFVLRNGAFTDVRIFDAAVGMAGGGDLAELAAIARFAQRKDDGADGLERSYFFRQQLEAQYDGSCGFSRKRIANNAWGVDCDAVD